MTLEEAMHTECKWCGEMAMNHRLTDSGNFYCLEFSGLTARFMRSVYPILSERRQAAMRAKCNELHKSRSLSERREIGEVIRDEWLSYGSTSATAEQLSL